MIINPKREEINDKICESTYWKLLLTNTVHNKVKGIFQKKKKETMVKPGW